VSLKRLRVQRDYVLPILLGLGIGIAALTVYPWITLALCGLAYLVSIPVTAARYATLARQEDAKLRAAEPTAPVPAPSAQPDPAPSDQRPAHYH
jgi:CDP-diacylglycerol--serine O-phosphatidyltransferase